MLRGTILGHLQNILTQADPLNDHLFFRNLSSSPEAHKGICAPSVALFIPPAFPLLLVSVSERLEE